MRYGHQTDSLRGFSRKHGINHFARSEDRARHHFSALNGPADLPTEPAYGLKPGHPTPGWPTLLRHPFAQTPVRWCRNINLLSITYAFRPRLRNRLTLSRLPLPRKPWTFGEWVSHPFYRYSCLHNHFQGLQQSLPVCLHRRLECSPTAPVPKNRSPRLRRRALAPLHFWRRPA